MVHCSNCSASLCATCDEASHALAFQKRHTRIPLGGGEEEEDAGAGAAAGGGGGLQSLDGLRAQLRRADRAIDKCKRSLSGLAQPHFPELSTSALGRLVDCDLLVDRKLDRDYEIVGEPLSQGQGKNTVLRVRLLGADGGAAGAGGGLSVLKQVQALLE